MEDNFSYKNCYQHGSYIRKMNKWIVNKIKHKICESQLSTSFLKLINYSCSSYPTRASYSGQVDGFRNPMKNKLKTRPCLKPVFETISNTDANFLNLHIDKATKIRGDKPLYLITHFTKQTLNLNYLLLTLNVTEQFLKNPKQKRPFFLNSRSMMATSCFGSL